MELKTSFSHTAIEPFCTGGKAVVVDNLLATTYDEQVIVTDLDTEQRILTIDGDGEVVTTMAISPDKKHLVVCSRSLQMRIFSLPDGALTRAVKAHEAPVLSIAVDPTSTLVATGGAEGRVKVWDIAGGYATHDLHGHGGVVSALAFWGQRGGTEWKLASGSDDTKVRLWDLVRKKAVGVLENHVSIVRGLAFSADGHTLLSAGRDKVVSVWQVADKKRPQLAKTFPVLEGVEAVGFVDEDAQTFFTGGEQGIVRLRSAVDGTLLVEEARAPSAEEVSCADVIYCAEHGVLYSILSDQTISELSARDSLKQLRCIAGNHGEIIDCCFLDRPNRMALATNSTDLRIVDLDRRLEARMLTGHKDIIISMDRSFDGRYIATAAKDNEARLWDVETGECLAVFKGHAGSVGAVGLPRAPTSVVTKKKKSGTATAVPDGAPQFVVTGSQDLTVKLWDVAKGQAVYTRKAHDKDINALDVSPDDRMFASASQDRTVKIWDLDSGESIGVLRGHRRGVWSVRFSHYDKQVVTGSGDKTVKLWNLHDFSCLRTFEGHANSVLKVVFLTAGRQIASAGGDGLVKVWDAQSGEASATLDNHEDKVWSLAVREPTTAEDTELLVSGGGDGVLTEWHDTTAEEKEKASEEQARQVELEQELDNKVRGKDWKNAILIALSLNHPGRLLKLFSEVREENEPESSTGLADVDAVVAKLPAESLVMLLSRVRDWNTNARTSAIAQGILHAVLRLRDADDLSQPAVVKLIDGILPYSERHYARIDDLLEQSYTIDYALNEMASLA